MMIWIVYHDCIHCSMFTMLTTAMLRASSHYFSFFTAQLYDYNYVHKVSYNKL